MKIQLDLGDIDLDSSHIEIWKSNQNQEERHYFRPEKGNDYLFGYNPLTVKLECL